MGKTRRVSSLSRSPSGPGRGILPGTLDMLVLRAVAVTPMHGWAIAHWILRESTFELHIDDGSLYPALRRLERSSLILVRWGRSEQNRRAKYYRISAPGKRALRSMLSDWRAFSAAISTTLARSALAAARRSRRRYGRGA